MAAKSSSLSHVSFFEVDDETKSTRALSFPFYQHFAGQNDQLRLKSSKFSFEYLLLTPRSALESVTPRLTPEASLQGPVPSYSLLQTFTQKKWARKLKINS